jgi:deazaflavin-dependent oxidoreductase (nitroreductase family)
MANWLAFTSAHGAVHRGTRGWIGGNPIEIRMLLLTTRGRKTGRPRTLPLACVEDRGELVVVASNGGAAKPPAWWLNLQAGEIAEVPVGAVRVALQGTRTAAPVSRPDRRSSSASLASVNA